MCVVTVCWSRLRRSEVVGLSLVSQDIRTWNAPKSPAQPLCDWLAFLSGTDFWALIGRGAGLTLNEHRKCSPAWDCSLTFAGAIAENKVTSCWVCFGFYASRNVLNTGLSCTEVCIRNMCDLMFILQKLWQRVWMLLACSLGANVS